MVGVLMIIGIIIMGKEVEALFQLPLKQSTHACNFNLSKFCFVVIVLVPLNQQRKSSCRTIKQHHLTCNIKYHKHQLQFMGFLLVFSNFSHQKSDLQHPYCNRNHPITKIKESKRLRWLTQLKIRVACGIDDLFLRLSPSRSHSLLFVFSVRPKRMG